MDAITERLATVTAALDSARLAAAGWRNVALRERLAVLRRARRLMAARAIALAGTLADRRPVVDTLMAEVLPLAEAARFLEREAPALLAPRRLGWLGRPLWLTGTRATILREPCGVVLILAPSNYPLMLPGVQILQALAAGNAVCAKPAPGGTEPLAALVGLLQEAGLPDGVLALLDEDAETGAAASRAGFDRIVLTGAAATGQAVLRAAAETLTPCTMELSGNDPVFVLPGAEIALVARCLAYGLQLNGGATCIAPRRVFVAHETAPALEAALAALLPAIPPVPVAAGPLARLIPLLDDAAARGARVSARPGAEGVPPIVVAGASPEMALLQADLMAPVLAIVPVANMTEALAAAGRCPYALGAAVFGPEADALALAGRIAAGSVVINDVIVPTADPRLPFGGRGRSGFGLTRGTEGLLEMTVVKTVGVRRSFRLHLDYAPDVGLAAGMIATLHGTGATRMAGLRSMLAAARRQPKAPGRRA